ncbi:hypothetical protein FRACYDRAFT_268987 [Fragilariopsis cylindrus CCMP1102]|uniref:Uncharacterized protein n=1 Tax=Fragilariopsis cylindrus CCMP1102 TaxID=635003 RepID=A0A1E7FEB5_9STRA|nr:hypothetical protein FRACYDRAFT_268987 [Fragilariopsis cylindrus CCMP1102]|eukprot:OEU16395.1 hypothetical protein FRACYDRAFT_268987 [Fragilariopsis cylindrus CCMP1102]
MVLTISYPATQALELEQDKTREAALSCEFFGLNFNDTTTTFSSNNVSAFPVIEWDNSESGSDSESVTSIDSWDSFLSSTDYAPPSDKLGKRRRNMSKTTSSTSSSSHRRLVRSKKIKSGLASLAMSPTARSA